MHIAGNNPPGKDIDQLVKKAAGGSAVAFGELYDIHVDRIYRHIYYRVGNTVDAEDLTQQVFIRAWQAIGRYRKQSVPFVAWLMTISRNLIIDFYRTRKEKIPLDDNYEVASREPGPEQIAEAEFEHREFIKIIARLPEEHRQVVIMRFMEECSYEEIAAVMNKSEGSIRVILHRALKRMRTLMEEGNEKHEAD